MGSVRRDRRGGVIRRRCIPICLVVILLSTAVQVFAIGPENVLILVNENSPSSIYISRLYRQYHASIEDWQVLYLEGLVDCSGPSGTSSSEIIERYQYEQCIAEPLRNYLSDANYPERLAQIRVIITTAGMPYRIEDTTYTDAVYANGSNPDTIVDRESSINAASVESELTCLWYLDYDGDGFGINNRMVNPYHGFQASQYDDFENFPPGSKQMNWTIGRSALAPLVSDPLMEGTVLPSQYPSPPDWQWKHYFGTVNRQFHPGDIYLTCRLDGPKNQHKSAVYAVRAMLERAKRASNPAIGVNPAKAVAVFDDAVTVTKNYDKNRVFNLDTGQDYWQFSQQYWDYDGIPSQPPDAPCFATVEEREDYIEGFKALTNVSPQSGILNVAAASVAHNVCVMLDRRNNAKVSQAELDAYAATDPDRVGEQGIVLLATYGRNGDEGYPSDYLITGGSDGGPLYKIVNGAVFASIESLNAVTMFSDMATDTVAQAKIVDFIQIGGSGAIGHAFEPQSDAAIDTEFLFYNLLADADQNGIADLTFIEAAFTAIPYLSWSEVVIGDPLMRIAYGPGQKAWTPLAGDADNDGRVIPYDLYKIKKRMGGCLNTTDQVSFGLYDDLCDIDKNGVIIPYDLYLAKRNLGLIADW